MCVWRRRRKEVATCGVTNMFDVVCDVCIVSRWLAGCFCVWLKQFERTQGSGEEEVSMCRSLLMAMGRDGETWSG